MIALSSKQKTAVLDFFESDIKLVKRYFSSVGFDFDDEFEYEVFKEFIYSAAGMIKSIDVSVYNKDLVGKFSAIKNLDEKHTEFRAKSEFALTVYQSAFLKHQENYQKEKKLYEDKQAQFQMVIATEARLHQKLTKLEAALEKKKDELSAKAIEQYKEQLKPIRREHVDAVHYLGIERKVLDEISQKLRSFEDGHREEFISIFNTMRDKLEYQFSESLNYFGFTFNEALFKNSASSRLIANFRKEAHIDGDLDLCKYVEYYLRNVAADALADISHQRKLKKAKAYCADQKRF
ncbi:MAG: hypothetical protein GQ570_06855 [Helicobacteraceae bacterium]|nr:hypothetical protein [Helicobacteraceae bacterium]